MENSLMYDWVSITSKSYSPSNFIELLGLNKDGIHWEIAKGAHGYRDRLYWEKISIHYNGREDMGVWLEMSGQGCRVFESFGSGDYAALFGEVLWDPEDMHLTRLDVAYDDHTGILPLDDIVRDTLELYEGKPVNYVCKTRRRAVHMEHLDDWYKFAMTVEHGARGSEFMVRIYDKAMERGFTDRHWVRCELQLRDQRALEYIQKLGDPGEVFRGVLLNYLRYVDEDLFDSNRWRWPMKKYWSDLLEDARRIRLYTKPGADYNMANVENYIFKQAANAVLTYIECYGEQAYMEQLHKQHPPMSAKYQQLIAQNKRKCYNVD